MSFFIISVSLVLTLTFSITNLTSFFTVHVSHIFKFLFSIKSVTNYFPIPVCWSFMFLYCFKTAASFFTIFVCLVLTFTCSITSFTASLRFFSLRLVSRELSAFLWGLFCLFVYLNISCKVIYEYCLQRIAFDFYNSLEEEVYNTVVEKDEMPLCYLR